MKINLLDKNNTASNNNLGKLAHYCLAIGNSTRLSILEEMTSNNNLTKNSIITVNNLSKFTVTINLKGLKKAGLIKGNFRARDISYQIDYDNLEEFKKLFDEFYYNLTVIKK